jgi:RNA polymerase sigma-70 factor (ECF subfamily)
VDDKAQTFLRHLEPLQGALETYCRRSLRDRNEVADALQSAIATSFRDFDVYVEGTNFQAWIFRYVSYEILNRNRAAERRQYVGVPTESLAAEGTGVDESLESAFDSLLRDPEVIMEQCDEALAMAIRELTEMERQALLLRAIGEFKYREIAEILEVPVGTVMSHLSRGRDRIRRRLAEFARDLGLLRDEG